MSSSHPNVVLICTDQWRGDCLGEAGHEVVATPFLDDLARAGTMATHAVSACPTCVPARMSLLTGQKASSHGRVGYVDGIDFDSGVTMAGEFGRQGYQTQAIGKMHVSPARATAGFDNVILHDGYLHHARKGRPDPRFVDDYWSWLAEQPGEGGLDADDYGDGAHCNSIVAKPWDRPERLHPTNWVTDQAIRWLYRRDPSRPFFLMLSYHRPHAPLNPPRWAWDYYEDVDFPQELRGNWEDEVLGDYRSSSPQAHVADYPDSVRHRALRGYYGNITHVDQQIERFLEGLVDFGVGETTIVGFTSDHGDMMGDHGMWRKGYPYRGSTHVPFILAGPGIGAGERIRQTVELIDIMPTLLEVAGLDIPDGIDGVPIIRRNDQADTSEVASVELTQRAYLHGEHIIFGQSLQWIWMDGYTYVWWSGTGREQLFNDAEDPDQLDDLLCEAHEAELSERDQDVLARARHTLVTELDGRPEGFVDDGRLVAGCPVTLVLPAGQREAVWLHD